MTKIKLKAQDYHFADEWNLSYVHVNCLTNETTLWQNTIYGSYQTHPPSLHTFPLRHTVNTSPIKFDHNDSDQNGNLAGNMTLQERKKNICSSTMDLSTSGTSSYHHPIACLQDITDHINCGQTRHFVLLLITIFVPLRGEQKLCCSHIEPHKFLLNILKTDSVAESCTGLRPGQVVYLLL